MSCQHQNLKRKNRKIYNFRDTEKIEIGNRYIYTER